jgi:hypothetical protein
MGIRPGPFQTFQPFNRFAPFKTFKTLRNHPANFVRAMLPSFRMQRKFHDSPKLRELGIYSRRVFICCFGKESHTSKGRFVDSCRSKLK